MNISMCGHKRCEGVFLHSSDIFLVVVLCVGFFFFFFGGGGGVVFCGSKSKIKLKDQMSKFFHFVLFIILKWWPL